MSWFSRSTRTDSLPETLGHYRLIRQLGRGGMGTVWLGEHVSLGTPAAIKVISDQRALSDKQIARFEFEARCTAKLTAPQVVRVWDYGPTGTGGYYYVSEFIQGLDLETLVSVHGPVPQARAVYLAEQVCAALADAHANGVVHRDLKPGNIMVGGTPSTADQIKVVDFGLVRAIGCDRDEPTTPENIAGTPAYLAPEVVLSECRGECDVDGRADLYALGCVLFWLLAGQIVFDAPTATRQAVAHATEPPKAPSTVAHQPIQPALEHVILLCLSKTADERPADAHALLGLLRATRLAEGWSRADALSWWHAHAPIDESLNGS